MGSEKKDGPGKPFLRILHTSDVHIGDELEPDLALRAFLAVCGCAVAEEVDLVIIAGDLFDSRRATKAHLQVVLEELNRLPMPVVILPGNHDPCDDSSPYHEIDIEQLPPHVHLIKKPAGELLRFPDLRLVLWGRPVIEHSPAFRPLSDIPSRNGDEWHVAVAHGEHVQQDCCSYRSSLIPEEAIIEAGWDYLALGHVHPYREILLDGSVACYSGSPARFLSSGHNSGHVALVELDPERGVSVRPVPIVV